MNKREAILKAIRLSNRPGGAAVVTLPVMEEYGVENRLSPRQYKDSDVVFEVESSYELMRVEQEDIDGMSDTFLLKYIDENILPYWDEMLNERDARRNAENWSLEDYDPD